MTLMTINNYPARILVAESEEQLCDLIVSSLSASGYELYTASNADEVLARFTVGTPVDLVLLDSMLPPTDGFQLTQIIRSRFDVPLILMLAIATTDNIVNGLVLGADDVVSKPFVFREIVARINAVLRRAKYSAAPATSPNLLRVQDLEMDATSHMLTIAGTPYQLTPIEFNLLHYFMARPGQIIGKRELVREVWGYQYHDSTNLVEVGVRRLRERIEPDPSAPKYIITVRRAGYRLNP